MLQILGGGSIFLNEKEKLTADEQELIKLFRNSDIRGQKFILNIAQTQMKLIQSEIKSQNFHVL